MLKILFTNRFKKDLKRAIKRGCKEEDLFEVVSFLANQKKLPQRYKDHSLQDTKDYKNARECHIYPNWLLIYSIDEGKLILTLFRNGTHNDLFM